jgi:glutamate synthase (ferredoxin)
MVELEKISDPDIETIRNLLANHYHYTQSPIAKKILADFKNESGKFIKVMPIEYKRILEEIKIENKLELAEVSDG